jgi:hypothetical protein
MEFEDVGDEKFVFDSYRIEGSIIHAHSPSAISLLRQQNKTGERAIFLMTFDFNNSLTIFSISSLW